MQIKRADVPLELEEIGLPMNTYGPKKPFFGEDRPRRGDKGAHALRLPSPLGTYLLAALAAFPCAAPWLLLGSH